MILEDILAAATTARPMIDAILSAYQTAKPHLMPEISDDARVSLFVQFRIGDLRTLETLSGAEAGIARAPVETSPVKPGRG